MKQVTAAWLLIGLSLVTSACAGDEREFEPLIWSMPFRCSMLATGEILTVTAGTQTVSVVTGQVFTVENRNYRLDSVDVKKHQVHFTDLTRKQRFIITGPLFMVKHKPRVQHRPPPYPEPRDRAAQER